MLMLERNVRINLQNILSAEVKMPAKGKKLFVSCPVSCPEGMCIEWTDKKSPEGKRLFNIGYIRLDNTPIPLFSY